MTQYVLSTDKQKKEKKTQNAMASINAGHRSSV